MAPDDSKSDVEPLGMTAQAVVGALTAFAGARLGGPEGAALASASLPYALRLAENARAEWRRDQRGNVAVMAAAAAIEAGWDPEELGEQTRRSATARMLTGMAAEAAAKTAWPPKVIALGRVLAAGLLADEDSVDIPQYALAGMTEMERLHLVLLHLLVRFRPEWDNPSGGNGAVPCTAEPKEDHASAGAIRRWDAGPRVWPTDGILLVRPQLAIVLPGVAGTLEQHGLSERRDRTSETLEQLKKSLTAARSQIRQMNSRDPSVRLRLEPPPVMLPNERSWAPTELGEHVLGFYSEAADIETPAIT